MRKQQRKISQMQHAEIFVYSLTEDPAFRVHQVPRKGFRTRRFVPATLTCRSKWKRVHHWGGKKRNQPRGRLAGVRSLFVRRKNAGKLVFRRWEASRSTRDTTFITTQKNMAPLTIHKENGKRRRKPVNKKRENHEAPMRSSRASASRRCYRIREAPAATRR